jgi:hypothetical protein
MNLANVTLLNYINMRRIEAKAPQVSTQKLLRYTDAEGDEQQRVMSLTHYHWIIFDTLVEQAGVEVADLMRTAQSYSTLKGVYIDQALETTVELIAQTFDVPMSEDARRRYSTVEKGQKHKGSLASNENKALRNKASEQEDENPFDGRAMHASDVDHNASKTLH